MASRIFSRTGSSTQGNSLSRDDRAGDVSDLEERSMRDADQKNIKHQTNESNAEASRVVDSRMAVDSAAMYDVGHLGKATRERRAQLQKSTTWLAHDDEQENDVPESLLIEPNEAEGSRPIQCDNRGTYIRHGINQKERPRPLRDHVEAHQNFHLRDAIRQHPLAPRSVVVPALGIEQREKALWRWANTSNLDSFMRDVYDYFEGGGLMCILCSNALWLL